MSAGRTRKGRPAGPGPRPKIPATEAPRPVTVHEPPDVRVIDLIADEITLARAQVDGGLPGLAEGTLLERIAAREADGSRADDELDALRGLLAEALWRQGRLVGARAALDSMRPASPHRQVAMAMIIEAEALAAVGEPDRAAGALERVISSVGVDEAHALRAGAPGRLHWPIPSEMQPPPDRRSRPPWARDAGADPVPVAAEPDDERTAAARVRLEEARVAYVAGDLHRGDADMSLAVRLDPALAPDGVGILEPTLGGQPAAGRLLLYGDLLRAAGRGAEAESAYDRAADRLADSGAAT